MNGKLATSLKSQGLRAIDILRHSLLRHSVAFPLSLEPKKRLGDGPHENGSLPETSLTTFGSKT